MKRLLVVLTSVLLLSACSGPDSSGGVALNKDNTSGTDFGAIKGPLFPDGSCKGLPDGYAALQPLSGYVVSEEGARTGGPQVYAVPPGGMAPEEDVGFLILRGSMLVSGVYYIGPGANLPNLAFANWALCRMNLTGANLKNGGFAGWSPTSSYRFSILNRVQMEGGDLLDADFSYSQINSANLQSVQMRSSSFNGSQITYTNLSGANLGGASLNNVNFTGSNFSKASLASTRVDGANFTKANLSGAVLKFMRGFETAIWTDVQFDERTICPNSRRRVDIGHDCPF